MAFWNKKDNPQQAVAPKHAAVGRNDPCPCGSGKKYKKCCEAKDAAQSTDAAELLRTGAGRMAPEEVARLRPIELANLDAVALRTPSLIELMRRAALFRRWELAE